MMNGKELEERIIKILKEIPDHERKKIGISCTNAQFNTLCETLPSCTWSARNLHGLFVALWSNGRLELTHLYQPNQVKIKGVKKTIQDYCEKKGIKYIDASELLNDPVTKISTKYKI